MRIVDEMIKKVAYDIEEQRYKQIKDKLIENGFAFSTEEEYHRFLKERLTVVVHAQEPHKKFLYLDLNSPNQKLIASWNETFDVEYDNGYLRVISGK